MKKKIPLVLSTALLLLATSSYTFSQSYVYRAPAPGIKASLSSGGLPALPDNRGDESEECVLSEGVFVILTAESTDNAEAEEYFNYFIQSFGGELYSSNTLRYVMENQDAPEPIVINSEDVFQPGKRLFPSSPVPGIDGLFNDTYELKICGSYEDNQTPPITENELEDILNDYDGKKEKNKQDKWKNIDDEYVEEFPGLDNWLPCGMHSDFYEWWDNNNYNNVYRIEC